MAISIVCPRCKTKCVAENASGNVRCACGVLLAIPSSPGKAPTPSAITTKPPIPVAPSVGPAKGNSAPERNAPLAMARAAWERSTAVHALGMASLGCLAFVLGLIPCVGMLGLPLCALGLLLGIVGVAVCVVRRGSGIGFPVAGAAVNGLVIAIAAFWALAAGLSGTVDNAGKGNQFAANPKDEAAGVLKPLIKEEAKEPKKGDPVIAKKDADKEPKTDPPIVKREPDNTEKKSALLDSKEAEALLKLAKAAQERAEAAEKRAAELLAKAEELEKKNAEAEKEIAEKRQELAALKKEIDAAKPKDKMAGVLKLTKAQFRAKVMTFTLSGKGVIEGAQRDNETGRWNGKNPPIVNTLGYYGYSKADYVFEMRIKDFIDAFGPPLHTRVIGAYGSMIWKCSDGEVHVRWKSKTEENINFIGIDEP